MKTNQESTFPPFTEAVLIVAGYSCIALYAIPKLQAVYEDTAQVLPALTRAIFWLSPLGLIGIAFVLGIAASLGRLRSDCRWMSRWTAMLLWVYGAVIVLALVAPTIL